MSSLFLLFWEILHILHKYASWSFLMHIYVLAKNYLDWVTTEHTFGRPKDKWWSWSERMMQLSSASNSILCFPKAKKRGLAQECRVGVWGCKKALNSLCIPVLPRGSTELNITGISFPSFIFPLSLLLPPSFSSFLPLLFLLLLLHSSPFLLHCSPPWDHCVEWCAMLLSLVCSSEFVSVYSSVADRILLPWFGLITSWNWNDRMKPVRWLHETLMQLVAAWLCVFCFPAWILYWNLH